MGVPPMYPPCIIQVAHDLVLKPMVTWGPPHQETPGVTPSHPPGFITLRQHGNQKRLPSGRPTRLAGKCPNEYGGFHGKIIEPMVNFPARHVSLRLCPGKVRIP